jgi:hypothetical protein
MQEKITNMSLQSDDIRKTEEEYIQSMYKDLPMPTEEVAIHRADPVDEARQHLQQAISQWANNTALERDGSEELIVG